MQNIIIMHVLYSVTDLFDNISNFLLRKSSLNFQMLIKSARRTQLHQKIETILICEDRV
jgi:hypothetical protein